MSELIIAGIELIAPKILEKISNSLNPSELKEAINKSVSSATKKENKQPPHNRLFFKSEPHLISYFLQGYFSNSEVIAELQKPLTSHELPDNDILTNVFESISEEYSNIKPQKRRIRPWIEAFSDQYFEQTVSNRYSVARNNYLHQLSVLFNDIKFAGISIASQESLKSERLSRIFVIPDVIEKQFDSLSYSQDFKYLKESRINTDQVTENYIEIFDGVYQPKIHGRRFLATQMFNNTRSKKIVLLGSPGSGKTLLMSFLSVMLTQKKPNYNMLGLDSNKNWLPILVRIRDWVREPKCSLIEYLYTFAKRNLSLDSLPPKFYEYWLEKGQALILLDGLDEIADYNTRISIADLISVFLALYDKNQAVITSRLTGYSPSFFPENETCHLVLQPFDPPKINLFIDKWYKSRFNDSSKAHRWQISLKSAISQNDRIKLLAQNPLLLTIIALVHRYEAYLPRHRHALYNRAVETLLTNWDAGKELDYIWPLDYLKRDSVRRLMERLAYWIHTQGDSNDSEGGTLISRNDLVHQLGQFIQEEDLSLKRYEAKKEAERFLQHIRDRSGLLNEQSPGFYAFVHKTFQEYLTTQEIRDRQEEGFNVVTYHISDYLHDPHWREVLLMLVAQQKRNNVKKALEHIFKYLDPYEAYLNRTLLFACSCFAEDIVLNDADFINQILETLVKLDCSSQPIVTRRVKNEIYKIICSLSKTRYSSFLFQNYLSNKLFLSDVKFLKYQALLDDSTLAIPRLIDMLESQSSVLRVEVINALGDIEDDSSMSINALTSLLRDNDITVRLSAIKSLGNIGVTNLQVFESLYNLLSDDNNQIKSQVIKVLSRMGYTSEEVRQYLINSLENEKPFLNYRIIEILCRMGVQSKKVSEYLLSNIANEELIHEESSKYIGELGDTSRNVIDTLLKYTTNDSSIIRSRALDALGRLGDTSDNILSTLRYCLNDKDDYVIYKAVESLERLGDNSQYLQEALFKLLENKNKNLCLFAIESLGRIGFRINVVKEYLDDFLNSPDSRLRRKSAEALGRLGDTTDNVTRILLANLEDTDPNIRFNSIDILGTLGKKSEKILESLLNLVGNEEGNITSSAAVILGNIGNTSQHVLNALRKKLHVNNPLICCNAASVIIRLGNSHPISLEIEKEVIDVLLNLLGCDIELVIHRATIAFGQLGKRDSRIADYLTDWITTNEDHEYVGFVVDILWDLVQEKHSSEKNYKII